MEEKSTILIVDDTTLGREVLALLLRPEGYHLAFAEDGVEALEKAAELTPDLILLDVMMPRMDGFEACQHLRADPALAHIPVIMVTALADHQSRLRSIEVGADEFVTKPFSPSELRASVQNALQSGRYSSNGSSDPARRKQLEEQLKQAHMGFAEAIGATIEGWSHTLKLRDVETEAHAVRVAEMTLHLAKAMGLSETELIHVRWGALLHDIGKIGIPDSILLKPGPLTDGEWEIMRKHPEYAYELLSESDFPHPTINIPHYHHEKWDGSGYPCGLKGKEIPLAARIFAVVDVWDALLSDRPYRSAWTEEKVRAYIREQSGKHFDPQVAEVFLSLEWQTSGWRAANGATLSAIR